MLPKDLLNVHHEGQIYVEKGYGQELRIEDYDYENFGARRKGIGTGLVNAALKAPEEEGICRAAVFVYYDNEIGMSFWRSQGFKIEDEYAYLDKDLITRKNEDRG